MDGPWLAVAIASLVLIGAAVAAMAIGVMFRRPCLRGSCGGRELRDASGQRLSCATCPNRTKRAAIDAEASDPAAPPAPAAVRPSR